MDLGDGRRGATVGDKRLVIKDGEARVLDAAAVEGLGSPYPIPAALGGGWLFSSWTSLHYADTFDGSLTRIAKLRGPLTVGVGHRRVLVMDDNSPIVLYELPSGKPVALDPPGMVELLGAPTGAVAARGSKGEVWWKRVAGAPWKRLAAPAQVPRALAHDGKNIVIVAEGAYYTLSADGKVTDWHGETGDLLPYNVWVFSPPFTKRVGAERVFDQQARLTDAKTAFLVEGTDLLFIDMDTGDTVQSLPGAFAGHEQCSAVRGGSPSFVGCGGAELHLFRIDSVGAKPVLERSFPGVRAYEFGEPLSDAPLVLRRTCNGTEQKGAACLRSSDGAWKDVPPPADPDGLLDKAIMSRVVATRQGRVFSFGTLAPRGDLVIADSGAKQVRKISSEAMPTWAHGLWSENVVTTDGGSLRVIIASRRGRQQGVVEIREDGSIDATQLDGEANGSGPRGLRITSDGKLLETLDAWRSVHEVQPPPGGIGFAKGESIQCFETGCMLGPWLRLGWTTQQ